jgi:hypothetical protein
MEASYYKEPLIQDPIKDWVIYPFSEGSVTITINLIIGVHL